MMDIEMVQEKLDNYRNFMVLMLILPWVMFFGVILIPLKIPGIMVTVYSSIIAITFAAGVILFFIWNDDVRTFGRNIEYLGRFDEECGRKVCIESYSPFSDFTSRMPKTVFFSSHDPSLPERFSIEFSENAGKKAWVKKKQTANWHQYPYFRLSVDFESEPRIAIIHGEVQTEDEQAMKLLAGLDLGNFPYPHIMTVQKISGFGGMAKGNRFVCDVYDYPPKTEEVLDALRAMRSITETLYPGRTIDPRPKQGWGICKVGGLTFCEQCDRFMGMVDFKRDKKRGPRTCPVCGEKLHGKFIERLNQ